jgi:hypothetical protein
MDEWDEFLRAVNTLPPEPKALFKLVWYEGLNHEQVARVLHVSSRTVRRRYRSAQMALDRYFNIDEWRRRESHRRSNAKPLRLTESAWLVATDPQPMLELIRPEASVRKLRLFCIGSVQHAYFSSPWGNETTRLAIERGMELAERYAEAHENAYHDSGEREDAYLLALYLANHDHLRTSAADLIRCIFGNPFRPVVLDPELRTSPVVSLVRSMCESREFGAMPILGDALQDAGCEQEEVLAHCYEPKPHVLGCWVCDLVVRRK